MKKLTSVATPKFGSVDVVIEYFFTAKKNPHGKIIWENEKMNIASCKAQTRGVVIYLPDPSEPTKIIPVTILPKSILDLAREIEETNRMTSNEFWED